MSYIVSVRGKSYKIEIQKYHAKEGEAIYSLLIDGQKKEVSLCTVNRDGYFSLLVDNRSYEFEVDKEDGEYHVFLENEKYSVRILGEKMKEIEEKTWGAKDGLLQIKAPMSGMVVCVKVKVGEALPAGKGMIILEAMKMQNELYAPKGGVVKEIMVNDGAKVNGGDILLVLE